MRQPNSPPRYNERFNYSYRAHDPYAAAPLVKKSVQYEANIFGYLLNIILATAWFVILFFLICSYLSFRLRLSSAIQAILGSACILLGGYHVFILHFDEHEMIVKEDDDITTRIIKSWPLVLGTLLFSIFMLCILKSFQRKYHDFLISMAIMNVPSVICALHLSEYSVSSTFRPWTVKPTENAETVHECHYVGVFVSIVMALIWFAMSVFFFNSGLSRSISTTSSSEFLL